MDLIESYITWLEMNRGRAPRTAKKYRQALERLVVYLAKEGKTLEQATREQLEAFTGLHAHKELKLRPRARRPLVAAVRGFYAWAASHGHVESNPAAAVDYPKAGRVLPRAMTLVSAEQLLMQCDLSEFRGVRDAAILSILIGCGPRISGVLSLNQEDLIWYAVEDRERLAIRFREKGDKERLVPAPIETALMIHAYLGHQELDGIDRSLESGDRVLFVSTRNRTVPPHEYNGEVRRLKARAFFQQLRKYGEKAGIPAEQLHPHAMRHLFGTELAEHDIDLLIRQDLLGHEDPKTTQIYTTLAMRKKSAAIDAANPLRKMNIPVSELARQLERSARRAP